MKYFVLGSTYVVRLDAGERIVEAIKALCERDAIGGGYFHGLGAVGEAEIGALLKIVAPLVYGEKFGWQGVDVFHFDAEGKIKEKYT